VPIDLLKLACLITDTSEFFNFGSRYDEGAASLNAEGTRLDCWI
jgi:hypothetical protein